MALRIYSNPSAIAIQSNLTYSQKSLMTSLQRLSSGLRINSASDDASGLLVSQKLQSQIMGTAMAARNAQDGISMLQTAEGGMRVVGDMLLRMRELAVQAGNGTYTASDRAELQKEMDQLKDEVSRVTTATEFNTKKLLNGNATALWSSSSDKVNVIVNSNVQAGDYRLDIATTAGRSAEYASHIMRLRDGEFAATLNGTQQGNLAYARTLEGQTFGTKGDGYNINVSDSADIKTIASGIATNLMNTVVISTVATYMKSQVDAAIAAGRGGESINEFVTSQFTVDFNRVLARAITDAGLQPPSQDIMSDTQIRVALAAKTNQGPSSPLSDIGTKVHEDYVTALSNGSPFSSTSGDSKKIANDFADKALNGGVGAAGQYFANGSAGNSVFAVNTTSTDLRTGYLEVTINSYKNPSLGGVQALSAVDTVAWKFIDAKTGEVQEGTQKVGFTGQTGGTALNTISGAITISGLANNVADFTVNFQLESGVDATTTGGNASSGNIALGSKMLVQVQGSMAGADLTTGGGIITLSPDGGANAKLSGGSLSIKYDAGELARKDNNDGIQDYTNAQFYFTNMDSLTGEINYAQLEFAFGETATGETQAITKDAPSHVEIREGGNLATATTRLEQIDSFVNADGVALLTGVEPLTLYGGNGKQQSVFLQGSMTIINLDNALTQALITMNLGADLNLAGSVEEAGKINDALVQFDPTTGTINMRSATLGSESTIAVVGRGELANAFGFSKYTNEVGSSLEVTTTDIRSGRVVSKETTTSSYLINSIAGTTIEILNAGVTASISGGQISFKGSTETANIHLVDNRTDLQIGANAGQTISVSIGQLDGKALGIDNAYVYDQGKAMEAISKLDSALVRLNSSRATAGAQINRLQYATTNLDAMRENLISANSRIVDADIAAETTLYTRNQVLQQAATAMLAQANALPMSALALIR